MFKVCEVRKSKVIEIRIYSFREHLFIYHETTQIILWQIYSNIHWVNREEITQIQVW